MKVSAVDHVNILVEDVDVSARFYEQLLDLKRTEPPEAGSGVPGAWMRDAGGNPIVHLRQFEPDKDYGRPHRVGEATGAFHHVSFRCEGYDDALARIAGMGIDCKTAAVEELGLRLIFVTDPSAITVEMSFAE